MVPIETYPELNPLSVVDFIVIGRLEFANLLIRSLGVTVEVFATATESQIFAPLQTILDRHRNGRWQC